MLSRSDSTRLHAQAPHALLHVWGLFILLLLSLGAGVPGQISALEADESEIELSAFAVELQDAHSVVGAGGDAPQPALPHGQLPRASFPSVSSPVGHGDVLNHRSRFLRGPSARAPPTRV